MDTYKDLIIIGSGPAGLATAIHLCKLNKQWKERMVLLERASHPRPKLCGGGLTRFGIKAIQKLGIQWPIPISQVNVDIIRLIYGRRIIQLQAKPEIVVFHRPELDAYLVEYARSLGIIIQENETAKSFTINKDCIELITDKGNYKSQVVVGADGSKGIVRQKINLISKITRTARVLEIILGNKDKTIGSIANQTLFDFTPTKQHLQGYYWQFPVRVANDITYNLGVYDSRTIRKDVRADLVQLLNVYATKYQLTHIQNQLSGHPIHWFSPYNVFKQDRLLLVGDSAGVDPLFGEGIGPSIAYGKIAAQAIQQAFRKNDFRFDNYPRMLMISDLGRYLLLRWIVARCVYRMKNHEWFMLSVWKAGDLLARIWPKPPPLHTFE